MDEKFYEKICRAYINTVNLEWVTTNPENNNSIVHGYFADDEDVIEQVTPENFKEITDGDDYYEYETWEDFYYEYIEESILDDIEDIGVYDYDDNWNFYITKENLIKLKLWNEEA